MAEPQTKRLVLDDLIAVPPKYREDVDALVKLCEAQGYELDPLHVFLAWKAVSEEVEAGWLFLNAYGNPVKEMRRYLVEKEEV